MTILNLMLGRGRGGLEQASVDYAEALALAHLEALSIITPGAWAEAPLVTDQLPHETLANANRFDPFAVWRLRRVAQRTKARAVICHGNRALALALRALKGRIPVIAVAHNQSTRRFGRADIGFAITQHLVAHLTRIGMAQVFHIPNMVRMPVLVTRPEFRSPPVIGAMGRLDSKKGFDVFLDALAELHQRGIDFRARLGGEGPELDPLRARIHAYGLDSKVSLIGWVKDKHAFFDSIDLFVVPSRQEAFGLTLIEAMAHAVPVITSDATGPREIAHHGEDALVVERDNVQALANALVTLLADHGLAVRLGRAGHALAGREYTLEAMAIRLKSALEGLI